MTRHPSQNIYLAAKMNYPALCQQHLKSLLPADAPQNCRALRLPELTGIHIMHHSRLYTTALAPSGQCVKESRIYVLQKRSCGLSWRWHFDRAPIDGLAKPF